LDESALRRRCSIIRYCSSSTRKGTEGFNGLGPLRVGLPIESKWLQRAGKPMWDHGCNRGEVVVDFLKSTHHVACLSPAASSYCGRYVSLHWWLQRAGKSMWDCGCNRGEVVVDFLKSTHHVACLSPALSSYCGRNVSLHWWRLPGVCKGRRSKGVYALWKTVAKSVSGVCSVVAPAEGNFKYAAVVDCFGKQ